MVIFYDVTRRLLDERLEMVKRGETPPFTDIRHFFYECRNKFLRENPELTEIDSKSKHQYEDWQNTITAWCMKRCKEFDINEEDWWHLRDQLNIFAEGRAVCEGESGKFLIDRETRLRVAEKCSFILLCEKKTVTRELLEKLRGEGYRLNIISTGGYSPSDVIESVIAVAEELDVEKPTFYFLVLHDYDRDGLKIYYKLKRRYQGVIDIGVNRELIEYLKEVGYDARLVEEKVENKNFQGELKEWIETSDDYTIEDFNYVQGEQVAKKRWVGKRIEIDAIHVQYGIEPFIKYTLKKIEEECPYFDLTRIGVEEFELREPTNHYEEAVKSFENRVADAYGYKLMEISKPLNSILDIVRKTAVQPREYSKLEEEHREDKVKERWEVSRGDERWIRAVKPVKGVEELKEEFKTQIEKRWKDDYVGDLDEINEQLKCYEGDVREAKEDLEKRVSDLQQKLSNAKKSDLDLKKFKMSLDEIDWGEEELEEIELPDEAEEIRLVINALQQRLVELGLEKGIKN